MILGQFGLPEWLAWLVEADHQPGIILNTDESELQTLFLEGNAAMLVSDASSRWVLKLPSSRFSRGLALLETDSLKLVK